jgi:hypothetical protein
MADGNLTRNISHNMKQQIINELYLGLRVTWFTSALQDENIF